MYLTLSWVLQLLQNAWIRYGTGTGTGTVREGKGREGIRDTFFNTYISDTLSYRQVGIVDMYRH